MSENRDREMRVELNGASKQDVLLALDHFLESQNWGRIGFDKDGELFSLWASSEVEPPTS